MDENLHLDGSGYGLIVGWEGKRNHSYLGSVRIPTIGIGFARYMLGACVGHEVCMGDTMADEETKVGFLNQVKPHENGVKEAVKVPLTQSQFNACVSLCYNISVATLAKSTVVRRLNERKYKAACNAFAMWNKAGGRVIPGLTNRRSSEQKKFFRNG